MTKTVKHIIMPEWLSKKKEHIGPRIRTYTKKQETDKAILIDLGGADGDNEYWLPKSQIKIDEHETHTLDEHDDNDNNGGDDDIEKAYPGIIMEDENDD